MVGSIGSIEQYEKEQAEYYEQIRADSRYPQWLRESIHHKLQKEINRETETFEERRSRIQIKQDILDDTRLTEQREIEGLFDIDGKQVKEGDIIEYFHEYFAYAAGDKKGVLYGVIRWNNIALTYEPILSGEQYDANSFAYVCKSQELEHSFFKVLGNVKESPEIILGLNIIQEVKSC